MGENGPTLGYRDPAWVAEQLGIDKDTVYRYLQDGTLPGLQLGRKWLISERRLAEFLERMEEEQTERRASHGGESGPKPPLSWRVRRALGLPASNVRFCDRAYRITRAAEEEARARNHERVRQEHLLLGVTRVGDALAAKALAKLGASADTIRGRIEALVPRGPEKAPKPTHVPLSPLAKHTIDCAIEEARKEQCAAVQSHHLLLGILIAGDGVGCHVLTALGISLEAVRSQIDLLLSEIA